MKRGFMLAAALSYVTGRRALHATARMRGRGAEEQPLHRRLRAPERVGHGHGAAPPPGRAHPGVHRR